MYSHPKFAQTAEETQQLRQQAGRWLRSLREATGMSQREVAKAMKLEYYTFISQLEAGRGRVPPAQYEQFAAVLNVPLRDFVKTLMRYYDPLTYYALFDTEEGVAAEAAAQPANDDGKAIKAEIDVDSIVERLAKLEALLAKSGKVPD